MSCISSIYVEISDYRSIVGIMLDLFERMHNAHVNVVIENKMQNFKQLPEWNVFNGIGILTCL